MCSSWRGFSGLTGRCTPRAGSSLRRPLQQMVSQGQLKSDSRNRKHTLGAHDSAGHLCSRERLSAQLQHGVLCRRHKRVEATTARRLCLVELWDDLGLRSDLGCHRLLLPHHAHISGPADPLHDGGALAKSRRAGGDRDAAPGARNRGGLWGAQHVCPRTVPPESNVSNCRRDGKEGKSSLEERPKSPRTLLSRPPGPLGNTSQTTLVESCCCATH